MKKLTTLLLLLCCIAMTEMAYCQTPALNFKMGKPTMEEMNMTEFADDPEADAVVLMKSCEVNYTVAQSYYTTITYDVKVRIKVLKDEGKRYGDISVIYIDDQETKDYTQEFYEFQATAYNLNDKGKITAAKASAANIFDERLDQTYKRRKVSIPQVRQGTVIEYHYKLFSTIFYMINDYALQEDIPVIYNNYKMEIPTLLQFNVDAPVNHPHVKCGVTVGQITMDVSNSLKAPVTIPTNCYNITATNMPALRGDDYVWCTADYCAKVVSDLKSTHFPGTVYQARRNTWEQIDELLLLQDEIGPRLNDKSKLSDQIKAAGIDTISNEKERIMAAIDLLTDNVAWNGEYGILANTFGSVLKQKNGSIADINMMLINMLNDLGMKSSPVFLSTRRHGALPLHPSVKAFNAMIVAVETSEGRCYVDASNPLGYINVLRPNYYVRQARVVNKKNCEFVDLSKLASSRQGMTMNAKLSADGTLKGEMTQVYTNNAMDEVRQVILKSENKNVDCYKQKLQDDNNIQINSLDLEGWPKVGKELKCNINFEAQAEVTDDHIYVCPFVVKPMSESPFKSETRDLPIELPYRIQQNHALFIDLPEGYEVEEMPKNFEITTPDHNIIARMKCYNEGDRVQVSFTFQVKSLVFDASQYSAIKSVYEQASQSVNDMIVLKKK